MEIKISNHWWWIVSLVGCFLVIFRNVMFRLVGSNITTFWWFVAALLSVSMMIAFWYSTYAAPSFFRVWFLGTVVLGLMGFGSSVFIFGEQVVLQHLLGAVLGLLGCFFLVW